jgi:tetrahydromethanopterin S-methyltransferase subunit A
MKQYLVQVRLSYYAWVDVEALDQYQAEDKAIRKAWDAMGKGSGAWGEEPEVVHLEEVDETTSD